MFCKGKIQSLYNVGIKAANWRGGNSFFPYPVGFNKKLKKEVWKRCGRICLLCGKLEEDEFIFIKRRLAVHHIDHDKNNLKLENLILLCSRCNSRVNSNDFYWRKYFKDKYGL